MKVQNIGQNNYNCQINQNSKNHPVFGSNVAARINFEDAPAISTHFSRRVLTAFREFVVKKHFVKDSDVLFNTAFAGKNTNGEVIIEVIDSSNPQVKKALEKLPPETVAKYREYCEKTISRTDSIPLITFPSYPDEYIACGDTISSAINKALEEDSDIIRFDIEKWALDHIVEHSENLPNAQGKVQTVPLWFKA